MASTMEWDGYRLTISFAEELQVSPLSVPYVLIPKKMTVEVSFCSIAIKHHIPEWYDI